MVGITDILNVNSSVQLVDNLADLDYVLINDSGELKKIAASYFTSRIISNITYNTTNSTLSVTFLNGAVTNVPMPRNS